MPNVGEIVSFLKRFAPLDLAADWDNVGLLLGDTHSTVQRILTCLTITPEVVAEAIETNTQLIVTHHPILFRPTQKLSSENREGSMLLPLMKAGIAVYSPHTAFDNTRGGINDMLTVRLGLTDVEPLRRSESKPQYKIVVFVPEADFSAVSDAMFNAGAGRIGEYAQCSFRISGTGTFFGSDASNPTIGRKGQREDVAELRLEVICPERDLTNVLNAMRKTHSYDEPAFDVYALKSTPSRQGEGRIGRLPQPMTLQKLGQRLKKQLKAGEIQLVGEPDRNVTRVALACGAAGEFLRDAERAKADVFITGEMRFHDYLTAKSQGVALLLAGHYPTERFALEELAELLAKQWPGMIASASERERDPVVWV